MATTIFTVKLGLAGLSPEQLVERGRAIVTAMTGNPAFPAPTTPPLADLTTACDDLETANVAVDNNGGRRDRLVRRERDRDLRRKLKELAGYVQAVSGGDPEIIASSGFETRRVPSPLGRLPAPGNMRARAAILPGVIDLRWDRVRGRLIYQLWVSAGDPLDPGTWHELGMTGRNFFTATGLDSRMVYSFRVNAVGAAGAGPLSDHATTRPL